MTFTHIAVFVWGDGVDGGRLGRKLQEALDGYVSGVEGVESYRCGPDAGFTSGTADFGVVGAFATREAYVSYRDAERHQAILANLIAPNLASRSVVQLED